MSILCNQLLNPKEQVDALVKLCIVLIPFLSFISYPPPNPTLDLFLLAIPFLYPLRVVPPTIFIQNYTHLSINQCWRLLFEMGNSYLGLLVVKDGIILLEKDVTED